MQARVPTLFVIVARLFAVIPITFADFPAYFGRKHKEFLGKGVGEWVRVVGITAWEPNRSRFG